MIAVVGLSTIIAGHILFYVALNNFADVIHATSVLLIKLRKYEDKQVALFRKVLVRDALGFHLYLLTAGIHDSAYDVVFMCSLVFLSVLKGLEAPPKSKAVNLLHKEGGCLPYKILKCVFLTSRW